MGSVSVESVSNLRELGGIPVVGGAIAEGQLFRSGHLGALSDQDEARLIDAGIRTIIDLRSDNDIASEGPDRVPAGVAHHRVPIHDDAGRGDDLRTIIMRGDLDELRAEMGEGRGHRIARDGAAGFVENPDRMASFARAMEVVTDPDNWPLLWHCSAGKDRAGWIGTAVLLAAGAEDDVIVDHYLESNHRIGASALFPESELKDLIRPFLEVHEDYVRAQLAVVDQRWGGPAGLYRDGFGLASDVVDRFRAELVVVAA